jgi:5-methylcytosine-specific restriction endonuclease McrA
MNTAAVLERQTLVLNKNWEPIQLTSVKEAISLVAKGSARILDREGMAHDLKSWNDLSKLRAELGENAVIRSCHLSLVQPKVILLTTYEKLGERSVVLSRKNIFKRDRYTCMYCGKQPGPEELTIDHVQPKSRGGMMSWLNCTLACVECNKRKANRTPEEAGMKLRKKPFKPTWKALVQINPKFREEDWDQFISRAYWEVELES